MEQTDPPEPSAAAGLHEYPRVLLWDGSFPAIHGSLLIPFPSQTKRTGTTGASRGMALYEEEVSPGSGTSSIHV